MKLRFCAFALGAVLVGCSDSKPAATPARDGGVGGTGGMGGAGGAGGAGGTAGGRSPLLDPVPPCMGESPVLGQGSASDIISKLEIAGLNEGFDFTGDMQVDNVLAPLGALANTPIKDSLAKADVALLIEWFDLDPAQLAMPDACVKSAIYVGKYQPDQDGDGARAGGPTDKPAHGGDCNDKEAAIHPGVAEVAGNRVDDDCDGLADETEQPGGDGGTMVVPSTDAMDLDGDGQSIAAGDCDDRPMIGAKSKKGGVEICGDGLDNDCSGAADDGCSPASANPPAVVDVDPLSLDMSGTPLIKFDSGTLMGGTIKAGPSVFTVKVPLVQDVEVELRIDAANVTGTLRSMDGQVYVDDVLLGGVLDARTLGRIKGFEVSAIMLTKDDTLLDLVFAGFLAQTRFLTLPKDKDGHLQPDIDVDGDGLESFWDSTPDDMPYRVDRCKDGDGTVVESTPSAPCELAMGPDGKPRFVDGISVALRFSAVPVKIGPVEPRR